jgi:hypothetical protein
MLVFRRHTHVPTFHCRIQHLKSLTFWYLHFFLWIRCKLTTQTPSTRNLLTQQVTSLFLNHLVTSSLSTKEQNHFVRQLVLRRGNSVTRYDETLLRMLTCL